MLVRVPLFPSLLLRQSRWSSPPVHLLLYYYYHYPYMHDVAFRVKPRRSNNPPPSPRIFLRTDSRPQLFPDSSTFKPLPKCLRRERAGFSLLLLLENSFAAVARMSKCCMRLTHPSPLPLYLSKVKVTPLPPAMEPCAKRFPL